MVGSGCEGQVEGGGGCLPVQGVAWSVVERRGDLVGVGLGEGVEVSGSW